MPAAHYPADVHLARAVDLGLDVPGSKKLTELVERAEYYESLSATAVSGDFASSDRLAAQLIDGSLDLTGLFAVVAANTSPAARNRLRFVFDAVTTEADRAVQAELAKIGDAWITSIIRPAVTEAVDRLRSIEPNVADGWTDSTVHLCDDSTTVEAFRDAQSAVDRIDALHHFADMLTGTNHNPRVASFDLVRLRRPHLWAEIPDMAVFSILEAIRRGAEPGIWLAAEVDAPDTADA